MPTTFTLKEGEILNLLSNRHPENKDEIANALKITPQHFSNLLKSQLLTRNIKERAAAFFGLDIGVFAGRLVYDIDGIDQVEEPDALYSKPADELTAGDVLKYMAEKDRIFELERIRHYKERDRLLGIIENLTKLK